MTVEGECYWIETNFDRNGYITSHLFVITHKLSNDVLVMVNFDKTRGKRIYDKTVIVEALEVPELLTEQSFANYSRSEIITEADLQKKITLGIAKIRGILDPIVLEKICDGILRSEDTPYEVRDLVEDLLFGSLS
jgi:hypothetical protein